MAQVPIVFGEWVMGVSAFYFVVDTTKGGRMFFLNQECTYANLVDMAICDFGLDMNTGSVEPSYSLPESMLQQMGPDSSFPPLNITNDSGIRNFIELGRTHLVRLCVSQSGNKSDERKVEKSEPVDHDESKNSDGNYEDESDEDEEDFVHEQHGDSDWSDSSVYDMEKPAPKKVSDDNDVDENYAPDDDPDVDYSKFGKVEGEETEDVKPFDFDSMKQSLRRKGRVFMQRWCDGIVKYKSFGSKGHVISELRLTAVMAKFAFRVSKSTKTLFVAKCRVKGCKWQLRAGVKNEPNTFWITGYSKVHTCAMGDRIASRKEVTPKYIANLFYESTRFINHITPEHNKICMLQMYGIKMTYTTAYRSLIYVHHLVRGSPEDGYARLPSYLHKLKFSNPGTRTSLEVDRENRFKFLFMALGLSVVGFVYLRRVVVVDGCHLPGTYGGVLLVATGQDDNFQLYPLAFAVVDSENDESWEWFFTKLNECISAETGLTIISDRHNSIKKAIDKVFLWADRGICYYHLQNNIVTKFKGKHMLYLVKNAAYAYTLADFDRNMAIITQINPDLADYLEAAAVRLWARIHFPGMRYNIQTSNIAESVNAMLKLAQTFPIAFILEFIREKLSIWYCKRREDVVRLTTPHSRGVEYLLAIRDYFATKMTVERVDGWRFLVKGGGRDCIVDLQRGSCGCGLWDVEKIPCSHAIVAAPELKMGISDLVCHTYRKDFLYAAYSGVIYPIIEEFKDPENKICLPPVVRRPLGRQKKSRWQSWLEISKMKGTKPRKMHKKYSCSQRHQPGHTAPKCVFKLEGY